MKHSEKEIIDALNVIKNVCNEYECHADCPFNDGYNCVINELEPYNWNIVDVKPTFKAFK